MILAIYKDCTLLWVQINGKRNALINIYLSVKIMVCICRSNFTDLSVIVQIALISDEMMVVHLYLLEKFDYLLKTGIPP